MCGTLDDERGHQHGDEPPGQGYGLALVLQCLAQHDELVGPQTGHRVGGPQDGADAVSELGQEVVPGAVPQAGVYVLEAVHVDEDHRQQPGRPAETAEGAAQAVHQQCPVGQGREGVEEGVAHELGLVGLARRQVPHEEPEERAPVVFGPHHGDFGGKMAPVAADHLHLFAHARPVSPGPRAVHGGQHLG